MLGNAEWETKRIREEIKNLQTRMSLLADQKIEAEAALALGFEDKWPEAERLVDHEGKPGSVDIEATEWVALMEPLLKKAMVKFEELATPYQGLLRDFRDHITHVHNVAKVLRIADLRDLTTLVKDLERKMPPRHERCGKSHEYGKCQL
jgi:hypothetical protein